jgi:hypothetical protein
VLSVNRRCRLPAAFDAEVKDSRPVLKDMEEYEKAKSEENEKRAKELDAEGSAGQDLMHKQGFSTYSVYNILEIIKEQIPVVAAQANVYVIVSKWDIIYQLPGIEFIDVTEMAAYSFCQPDVLKPHIDALMRIS